tara:strand:- start:2781 stop:3125 length:345 start_codon:yes stop_codon:yes gene_type:complete
LNKKSLCGICGNPAQGFFFKHKGIYYASCSMKHLDKLKERIEKGEKLARRTYTNALGVEYARKQSKEKYLEIAKQSGSFELHKWTNEQRDSFFNTIILNYFDFETELNNNNGSD